jgi:hypothetical protein
MFYERLCRNFKVLIGGAAFSSNSQDVFRHQMLRAVASMMRRLS